MLIDKFGNRENHPGILENSVEYAFNTTAMGKGALLYPEYIGDIYCDTEYCISRNSYGHYLLMHVLSGTAVLNSGGCDYEVEAGQTFLIETAKPHVYGCMSDMHCLWMHFGGNGSKELVDYLVSKNGMRHVFDLHPNSEYVDKFWELYRIFDSNSVESELALSVRIYEILGLLGAGSQPSQGSQIDKVINYINHHYAEEVELEKLAKIAQLSVSRFSEVFKIETKSSPYKYVINTRLHAACRLLSSTTMPVADIAEAVGFGSATSFISSFRQKYGITPKQYMIRLKADR